MAKGGFPRGGMPNMNHMMKQMQKMQKELEETQARLDQTETVASSGGGAVEAVVNGKKELLRLTIDPEVIDPEDRDMLQDLIMAAVNEALRKASEQNEEAMSKITGGINIPGL